MNRSCPAVSQTCILTSLSLTRTLHVTNDAPMVDVTLSTLSISLFPPPMLILLDSATLSGLKTTTNEVLPTSVGWRKRDREISQIGY